MSVIIVLSEPWGPGVEELGLEPTLELGPFESVTFDGGWWMGDGDPVAEVFRETIDDMMIITGHPLADYVLVPRTFQVDERDDPEYPGRPYLMVEVRSS